MKEVRGVDCGLAEPLNSLLKDAMKIFLVLVGDRRSGVRSMFRA